MRKDTDRDSAEFEGVISKLRDERHEATPLELDQIKEQIRTRREVQS